MPKTINIRFYEELNDFIPVARKKLAFQHSFSGNMTIKDVVESLGVPHTEIDLILINGESVTFKYRPGDGDFISVYPVFESFNISNVTHLRTKPLRITKFILDVHLGKLARHLRMLGFDSLYQNDYSDREIIDVSVTEKRIILTRDIGILKNSAVTHGYWVRSQNHKEQLKEVITHFDLTATMHASLLLNPLSRCLDCNGVIRKVEKENIINVLQPKTKKYYEDFFQCTKCQKVYWKGSHYNKMKLLIDDLLKCY